MKPLSERGRRVDTMGSGLLEDLTPLTRAILEALEDGAIVLDMDGAVAYANAGGRAVLRTTGTEGEGREQMLPRLSRLGSRVTPLWVGDAKVGEIIVIPSPVAPESEQSTLAERERQAIIHTLSETGGKLTESARRLGISRTTLWRRLRDYGIDRDHRARWSRSS
jgi:transcriptional regulator with PAS, ATPase and Fis domain